MNSQVKAELLKYKKNMNRMFYVFFTLIILFHILSATSLLSMFAAMIGNRLHGFTGDQILLILWSIMNIRLLIAIPAIYTILVDMEKTWEKILGIGLLLLGWFYALYMREWNDTTIFTYSLLLVASYRKDFIKILKCSIYAICTVMVIAFVMDRMGMFPSLDLERNGRIRHAFGMNGPTVIAGHVCFIIIMIAFLKNGRLKWYDYIAITILCVLNLLYVDGRVAFLCTVLAACGCLCGGVFERKRWKLPDTITKIFRYMMCASYAVLGVGFMIMAFFYQPERFRVFGKIEFLSSFEGRFEVAHRLLEDLHTSLLGNYYAKYYYAEHSYVQNGDYLFIDSSYARLYIIYGVVGFVFGLVMCTLMQWRLMKEKMTLRMYLLTVCAVFYIVQKGIFEPTYNIFPLLIAATLNDKGAEGVLGKDNEDRNKDKDIVEGE